MSSQVGRPLCCCQGGVTYCRSGDRVLCCCVQHEWIGVQAVKHADWQKVTHSTFIPLTEIRVILHVDMMCSGCTGAVKRILDKMEGVESYDISLETKKVVVNGAGLDPETVKAKIAKTGKETKFWTD